MIEARCDIDDDPDDEPDQMRLYERLTAAEVG
jgi:hypothetical protein